MKFWRWNIGTKTSPKPSPNVLWIGWIRAKKDDEQTLRNLGVEGPMVYRDGVFAHCWCSEEVFAKLKSGKLYPAFDSKVFSRATGDDLHSYLREHGGWR